MNNAIFLDRDGTIIEDKGYIRSLYESKIFPFAFEAVRRLKSLGFKLIVVTNQSSVARGICKEEDVEKLHDDIQEEFLKNESSFDRFYYCPYHTEGNIEKYKKKHAWRKPEPGMLLEAAKDMNINLASSFMIGDNVGDVLAGKNAGCRTILVMTGKGAEAKEELLAMNILPDFITENLLTAAAIIENEIKK